MSFTEQLKTYRKKRNMTQEQMAELLNVSCETLSQWENGVNPPDCETLASISNILDFSHDQPLPASDDKDVAAKPSQKQKQTRKISIEINLLFFVVGVLFLIAGIGCIWIKGNTVEYIDVAGWLYESFFLLPIGMLLLLCGTAVILATGIKGFIDRGEKRLKQ